eukprot:CAMPEP_0176415760 /NCGR_PEP_ID=MMETSP0127-20121128/5983_1 /TAXON_ID=938130 /ORGANISM="Platyophrya macrostoma, Strain WH" /LENGTH=400 /DNA_ID=CAMNT_0017795787 /DNA_START=6 /DNA_END=1208 /DNA_ORIENTATION=-
MEAEYTEEYENQIINEEYKIWKKNAPFLYDLAITHVLEWPSLTCQWLPSKESPSGSDYTIHKMILGTHTSDQEPNYLLIAKVRIPNEDATIDVTEYSLSSKEQNGIGVPSVENRIEIETKILHKGEVNRARYMPQKYNVIATKTTSGEVHVFDYTQHPSIPDSTEHARPDLILTGHTKEGYGLSWNEKKAGYLLSGSNDGKICLWNIEDSNVVTKAIKPLNEFNYHKGSVGDVCWHPLDINAHTDEIYSIDFNKNDEYLFITGGADKIICLWDLRNPSKSLHVFENHKEEVIKCEWSPNHSYMFASCSSDRRINVWDMTKIGQDQKGEDALDGPPELLFIHGGHRAKIPDFSWNLNDPMLFASVEEENNILHVWNMASSIYNDDEDEGKEGKKGEMVIEK